MPILIWGGRILGGAVSFLLPSFLTGSEKTPEVTTNWTPSVSWDWYYTKYVLPNKNLISFGLIAILAYFLFKKKRK